MNQAAKKTNRRIGGDCQYVTASDSLPARKSGDWAQRKHHFLRKYCDAATRAVQGKGLRLAYLDVMAGPGRCKLEETGEEFPGSPFVALEYPFDDYILIEEHPDLVAALRQRTGTHAKANQIKVIDRCWIEVIRAGALQFAPKTLIIAFIDPTGISQMPLDAVLKLAENPKIDLLITIQHSLGITLNVRQYVKSTSGQTALDSFLGHSDWRKWNWNEEKEFTRKAVDSFSKQVEQKGFKPARHIIVPEQQPLYRFTAFSRHPLGEKLWREITKIDEHGQKELFPT